jgi:hypothetical protein
VTLTNSIRTSFVVMQTLERYQAINTGNNK